MVKKEFRIVLILGSAAILLALSGCATSRGVLDVRVPEIAEPTDGPRVYIGDVEDNRVFEIKPNKPSIPSLKDGQIDNEELTSRAIARKRNSYGMAMGDIMLPEGRTVEQLIRETIEEALKEKGYTVVESEGSGVTTMDADIQKAWAWFSPGFWTVGLDYESEVILTSDVLINAPTDTVTGEASLRSGAAGSRAYMNTFDKGLEDLRASIVDALKNP